MSVYDKRAVLCEMLDRAAVKIIVDNQHAGLKRPEHLADEQVIAFDIGHALKIPIPDLVIDDDGIAATLSFNRTPFACFVPWDALLAAIPFDEAVMVQWGTQPSDAAPSKPSRPNLSVVK